MPRCPHCGHRSGFAIGAAPPRPAGGSRRARAEPPSGGTFQKLVLTETQKELLVSAIAGSELVPRIHLQGPTELGSGEVKAGNHRLFGDDALLAAMDLVAPGLVVRVSEDCYELTEDGIRAAELMRNPLRRRSTEIYLPTAPRKRPPKRSL